MVNALEKAWSALRADGALIEIRPDINFAYRIGLVSDGRRMTAGRLVNPIFDEYVLAAGAAVNEVLRQGRYKLEEVRRHPYRVRLDRLTDVPRYVQATGEPHPRFVAGTQARLRQLWRGRTTNTRIEVTDGLVISLLRKR
jgi:hypothetical protein